MPGRSSTCSCALLIRKKEPPVGVVSTALSAMAFEYPADKLSVYVSDDGGADVTLFAFMEGARFARHWLPFCRENGVQVRSPEVFFASSSSSGCSAGGGDVDKLKVVNFLCILCIDMAEIAAKQLLDEMPHSRVPTN